MSKFSENHATQENPVSLPTLLENSLNHILKYGFPNYFGRQRMGVLHENLKSDFSDDYMPIGPTIGKLLLLQQYKQVVDAIILGEMYVDASKSGCDLDSSQANNARRMYLAGSPLQLVLSLFPTASVRERTILRGLIRYGKDDPKRLIDLLPYSAITLYVSAYQSFIWNKICSYRLSKYGMRPVAGDLILGDDGGTRVLSEDELAKNQHDSDASLNLLKKVTLPLLRARSEYPKNDVGR